MKKMPKPRNPFVRHLITKKQGPMGPNSKQLKKSARVALKNLVKTGSYE